MANTNTLLAPTPKDRAVTTTDPVKEAAQPPGAAAADRHSRTAQSRRRTRTWLPAPTNTGRSEVARTVLPKWIGSERKPICD